MNIYSASDIAEKTLSPPQMIVEGLLPVGLSALAGSPKLGKSWMALSLAYSVAQGEPFLNHPTAQGDVLYVDLEGSPYRIKTRMETLGYSYPSTLQIAHDAKEMGKGLLDDLNWWWERAPLPKLIIIDTIGRKKSSGSRTLNSYENDTKAFDPFQRFALEKELSIMCVTHLKKDVPFRCDDWVERISGSMGFIGDCDAVWGLFRKRGESTGYLRTTARDVDAGDLVCRFDNGLWSFVSDDVDNYAFRENPIVKFIMELGHYNGRADDLCNQYLTFCKNRCLPHGLSEAQPENSFGKQMKPLMVQGWRINKSITRERRTDGVYYWIGNIT